MTITQAVIARERFYQENTPEKCVARVKRITKELFPDEWVKEVANGMMAGFAAQFTL